MMGQTAVGVPLLICLINICLCLCRALSDKDREMHSKIDEVRSDVASMWEDRLL